MPSSPASLLFPYTTFFRSLFDAAYLTAGIRNERIGQPTGLSQYATLPMVGVAFVRDYGAATFKLRGAYGRGIRAPHSSSHPVRSEEHTSELQSLTNLVCRLLQLLYSFPTRRSSDLSSMLRISQRGFGTSGSASRLDCRNTRRSRWSASRSCVTTERRRSSCAARMDEESARHTPRAIP